MTHSTSKSTSNHSDIDIFIDAIWMEGGLAKNTLSAYRSDLLTLEKWAKNKKLSLQKISRADELDYVSERLKCYKVNNITSGDLRIQDGIPYPTGHSSASYVFDLSDEALFENIYLSCK